MMAPYQRRRSDASSAQDSVISAITMDTEDFSSRHSRSLHRFDPTLCSLAEQKRSSDPDEEEVKLCLDELRVPGRNNNRFSSFSEGDKQLCAIPRRRLSVEMELSIKPAQNYQFGGETKEAQEVLDIDDDDSSQGSAETLEGSYYAYDAVEMELEEFYDYEYPLKIGDDRTKYDGQPRRNYRRRCRSTNSTSSVSLWVAASNMNANDKNHSRCEDRPRRNYRSGASSVASDDQIYNRPRRNYHKGGRRSTASSVASHDNRRYGYNRSSCP